ncbi:MAG: hypothetical protein CSYNP_04043 [Syntrophus sp. SKADARSKE-3]|nr:hypothetical protein [Syntrophus sp. SKADARSKE-3]
MKRFILSNAILFFILLYATTSTTDMRGLQVIAKDVGSGKEGIVRIYNKSYAVVIGIDRYQNLSTMRRLHNAVKDAKGIEEILCRKYHFDQIITLINEQATKDRILELLTEELPAKMVKEDALLLFWAGHGNQEKSDFGKIGYLIPYDGDALKIRKNITMTEIRDTISKKIPAKHVFYIMDACYSGLLTTRGATGKTRRDLSYLNEITKESARQVLTAGDEGQESLDGGPQGHSVFTGRLIETLESSSDFITANELQATIREKVFSDASARNHTQTPGFGILYGMGDFVFIPKNVSKEGATDNSVVHKKGNEQAEQKSSDPLNAFNREKCRHDAITWSRKSSNFAASKNWSEMLRTASAAIKIDPTYTEAYVNRSWAYLEKGFPDKALEDCNKALSLDSKNPRALNNCGLIYLRKNDHEKAKSNFLAACNGGIEIACDNYKLITGYKPTEKTGFCIKNAEECFIKKDWDRVIKHTTDILIDDPTNEIALSVRAAAYAYKGLYNEAIKDCDQAISKNPDYPVSYNNKAFAYELIGNKAEALLNYEFACNLSMPLACENLKKLKKQWPSRQ